MAKLCPYTGGDVVYLTCQECENKVCEQDLFACLIAGSRTFNDYPLLKQKMDFLLKNQKEVLIISGGAKGADSLAERYAKESPKCSHLIIMPAEWDVYGKAAGYIRNEKMHKALTCFENRGCVLFWDGESKGTRQNIPLAKKYNTAIKIIKY